MIAGRKSSAKKRQGSETTIESCGTNNGGKLPLSAEHPRQNLYFLGHSVTSPKSLCFSAAEGELHWHWASVGTSAVPLQGWFQPLLQTRLAHQKAVNIQACTMNTRRPGHRLQLDSQAHRASAGGSSAPLVSSLLFKQLEHFSSGWSWGNSQRSGQIMYRSSGSDNSDPFSRLLLTFQYLKLAFISQALAWKSAKLLLLSYRSKEEDHQCVWSYIQGSNPLLNSIMLLFILVFLNPLLLFWYMMQVNITENMLFKGSSLGEIHFRTTQLS